MLTRICFSLAVAALALPALTWLAVRKLRGRILGEMISLKSCLLAGTFLACLLIHVPMCWSAGEYAAGGAFARVIAPLYHTLRVFILGGEIDPVVGYTTQAVGDTWPYFFFIRFIYVLAPAMTFTCFFGTHQKRFRVREAERLSFF